MTSGQVTIAFIGGAGTTLSHIIALSLKAGHRVVALARTPSKLFSALEHTHNIPKSALESNVIAVQGSARDLGALKNLLRYNPKFIVTGLTSLPDFHFNPFRPVTMQDPTLIGDSASLVLRALHELKDEGALSSAPLFVPISSTGISVQRDLPLIMRPLYDWLLPEAIADTKDMETVVSKDVLGGKSALGGYVFVRAPLLTGNPGKGLERVRVGWVRHDSDGQGEKGPGPAVGYTISRADLAEWIFEEVIQARREWTGKCVTLAY
ncbi:hypothetical protein BN1708_011967 [Verticillium longisporum]|uniref:NAD(P)-binding domain-containing protein n=1 Tax=Verticillium longisporum TaxID=100787 RepID=A0A0G4L5A1_VERLO|nr:hypothetical protein BN1708_011967 [Verticillium longisporum]